MTDQINQTSHALGLLTGEIKGMAIEIHGLSKKTNEVHEKIMQLDSGLSKSHWRHDDADKKIIDIKEEIERIAEKVQNHDDLKKKAIWATLGLSLGGSFAGSKLAQFFTMIFGP